MKFDTKIPSHICNGEWKYDLERDDGYSEKYLEFIRQHRTKFPAMSIKEVELLKLLVDNDFGRLTAIVDTYKNIKNGKI